MWCQCVRVLSSVLILISLADMVCELDLLSVSNFEVDGPQTFPVS